MDEPAGVGMLEGFGDLDADIESVFLRAAFVLYDVVIDGAAVDVLHHEVVVFTGLADVESADDVGVVELGGGAAFGVETLDELRAAGELFGEDFDGDEAVEGELLGFVDGGHGAGTELAEDFVAGDLLAGAFGLGHLAEALELTLGDELVADELVGEGGLVGILNR